MSKIFYNGQSYIVIDETDAHYICIEEGGDESGYFLMAKAAAHAGI